VDALETVTNLAAHDDPDADGGVPHVSLWLPNNLEAVAIASKSRCRIDQEQLRQRMAPRRNCGPI